jgi:hypothetical protein
LESVAKLQAANTRATIISYDAAYHWLHQDEPERFDTDVWAFFERCAGWKRRVAMPKT